MKRKVEATHQVEAKIPSLSTFLKEENLNVDDIETDVDQFLECYNQFVKYTTDILDLKEKANPSKVSSIIIKFKELNRKAQFRLNISREKTKETKDAINKNHLAMQNLLYEALHLEKETNSCLEFKSLHEDVELVSLDEFTQCGDSSLTTYESDHELTINRLHWELTQRKNLSSQITSAEEMEQQLLIEINKKKQAYTEITTNLKAVFETTRPLENIFDLPMHHQDEQNELVEELPEALYVLYVQMQIQADLGEKDLRVELIREQNAVYVLVTMQTSSDLSLVLTFQWDEVLQLVTVLPRLEPNVDRDSVTTSPLSKCFLESLTLLSELSGDTGCPMQSPWIKAKLEHIVNEPETPIVGLPYVWCQQIGGAFSDFGVQVCTGKAALPSEYLASHVSTVTRVMQSRVLSELIRDIRERVKTRLKLTADMDRLSSLPRNMSASVTISNIGNWTVSSLAHFKKFAESNIFIASGLANDQCFYFGAVIRSIRYQNDDIPMWLIVPHNYPNSHPIIVLSKTAIRLPAQEQPGGLALVLHLLEVEVNCFCEEFPDDILNRQIQRLLSGMDILLDHLHGGCSDNKLNQILIGNKYPVSKRPFRSA